MSGRENEGLFYECLGGLRSEFERVRQQHQELCAENALLRRRLDSAVREAAKLSRLRNLDTIYTEDASGEAGNDEHPVTQIMIRGASRTLTKVIRKGDMDRAVSERGDLTPPVLQPKDTALDEDALSVASEDMDAAIEEVVVAKGEQVKIGVTAASRGTKPARGCISAALVNSSEQTAPDGPQSTHSSVKDLLPLPCSEGEDAVRNSENMMGSLSSFGMFQQPLAVGDGNSEGKVLAQLRRPSEQVSEGPRLTHVHTDGTARSEGPRISVTSRSPTSRADRRISTSGCSLRQVPTNGTVGTMKRSDTLEHSVCSRTTFGGQEHVGNEEVVAQDFELLRIWSAKKKRGFRPHISSLSDPDGGEAGSGRGSSYITGLSSQSSIMNTLHRFDKLLLSARSERERGASWEKALSRFMLKPGTLKTSAWDIFVGLILIYDLVLVPMHAFKKFNAPVFVCMDILTTSVWTIDTVVTFFFGYHVNGALEMRPKKIAMNYIRKWFMFDVLLVCFDWAALKVDLLNGNSDDRAPDVAFLSRLRRVGRMLRLTRLLRHKGRYLQFFNNIHSETTLVASKILALMIALVFINHVVACGWYALGTSGLNEYSWIDINFREADTIAYRYTTSFHWSITQFTPASMEVTPTNELERTYNVMAILFGLLTFSFFVSNLTNALTYLTNRRYDKARQLDALRHYLDSKALSSGLAIEIMGHVKANEKQKRRILEGDIAVLKDVPRVLIERLRFEVHAKVLDRHPLFSQMRALDFGVFHGLCQCVSEQACIMGEEVFRYGVKPERMFFVVDGTFTYVTGFCESEHTPIEISQRTWLCEASLWVKWECRGKLTAMCPSAELAVLDAIECHTIFSRSVCFSQLRSYAHFYMQSMQRELASADNDFVVSDIWGQRLKVSDLVRKAFMSDSDSAAKAMLLLWGQSNLDEKQAFLLWKRYVNKERMIRQMGGIRGHVLRLLRRVGCNH